jgi:hypothetical protein
MVSDSAVRFLVIQYLEGRRRFRSDRGGPLPPKEALSTAIQIADVGWRASRRDHRDLKPATSCRPGPAPSSDFRSLPRAASPPAPGCRCATTLPT